MAGADAPKPLLNEGDWVDIDGMAAPGRIVSIDAKRRQATVLVRDQEWRLPLKKLKPGEGPLVEDSHAHAAISLTRSSEPTPHEVDLHGMCVDDALMAADLAVDRAAAGGALSLRIIHGHGTGRVRAAVREMLAKHPLAAHYRFGGPGEGGLASTIVEIKSTRA